MTLALTLGAAKSIALGTAGIRMAVSAINAYLYLSRSKIARDMKGKET